MLMRLSLLDTLWKFGFRSLSIGFSVVSIVIFLFFGLEINRMYNQSAHLIYDLQTVYEEEVGQLNQKLDNIGSKLSGMLKANLDNPSKLNTLLQKANQKHKLASAVIYNSDGVIIAKHNFSADFIIMNEKLTSSKLGQRNGNIIYTTLLAPEIYLTLLTNTQKITFDKYIRLKNAYNKMLNSRWIFYLVMIIIFLIILSVFLIFSIYVIKRVSNKLLINLNNLLNSAQNTNQFRAPNEIKEFHNIARILAINMNHLNQQNSLIQNVFNNVNNGIILFNQRHKIDLINQQAKDFLAKYNTLENDIIQIIQDKNETFLEEINTQHQCFAISGNVFNKKILVIINDITDQVTLEKQIAWRDVARVIAHEIKNPLTPTKLSAEQLLYSKKLTSEKREQYITTIINNVNQVDRLINDFVGFAKQSQQSVHLGCFDLSILLQEIIDEQKLINKNINFDFNPEAVMVIADREQLHQALVNLIQNAAQAVLSVNNPVIKVTANYDDKKCSITIEDNGVGLTMNPKKLFQPYVTTKKHGTGLGLVIAKKIAQTHGGNVELEKLAHGTKATFTFCHQ